MKPFTVIFVILIGLSIGVSAVWWFQPKEPSPCIPIVEHVAPVDPAIAENRERWEAFKKAKNCNVIKVMTYEKVWKCRGIEYWEDREEAPWIDP